MPRSVCPELYPDPRPSRLLVPVLPYLPRVLRLLPWLAAAPAVVALGAVVLATLPLLTWLVISLAVLTPLAAGAMLFRFGWD